MIDFENMQTIVTKGLRAYLNCPVICSNQNAPLPDYPFISYTVTMPMRENKGTYGVYDDGKDRKPFEQTWSISALSDNNDESISLANKAHEWLDYVGKVYLSDNGVDVQSVGSVTNRDNVIGIDYEYKNGFDAVFYLMNEVENLANATGTIESVQLANIDIIEKEDYEKVIAELQTELKKAQADLDIAQARVNTLENEIAEADETISNLIGANDALTAELSVANEQLSEAQKELASAKSTVKRLETQLSNLQTQYDTTYEQLQLANEQIDSQTETIATLEGNLSSANTQIENLVADLNSANEQITNLTATISSLEADLETANDTISRLENDVANLDTQNMAYAAEIQRRDEALDEIIALQNQYIGGDVA